MIDRYQELAHAIIELAVKDYRFNPSLRIEVKAFIKSDWFLLLTDLDPDQLLKYLDKIDRKKR